MSGLGVSKVVDSDRRDYKTCDLVWPRYQRPPFLLHLDSRHAIEEKKKRFAMVMPWKSSFYLFIVRCARYDCICLIIWYMLSEERWKGICFISFRRCGSASWTVCESCRMLCGWIIGCAGRCEKVCFHTTAQYISSHCNSYSSITSLPHLVLRPVNWIELNCTCR